MTRARGARHGGGAGRAAAWLFALGVLAASTARAAPPAQVLIDDTMVFPESLTSTAAGDLINGSIQTGTIYRAHAGAPKAERWIEPAASGMGTVLGVLADDASNTLYVCSVLGRAPPEQAARLSALRTFDLKTGAPKGAYPMPGGAAALCNDIAIGRDGTAYLTDTRQGRLLRLRRGAQDIEVWAKDERLVGADGLAFGADGAIYLNTFSSGRFFRVAMGPNGEAGPVSELQTSSKLDHPDGLRPLGGNRFVMAEGGGRISEVVVSGDQATIIPLKSDVPGVVAVTLVKGTVWYINGKLAYRNDPNLKGKDPGPFTIDQMQLPPR